MKIKSLIVSLIAILVVFGTVSFAAEYDISLDPVEYTAGTGYVDVKLVADETVTSVKSYASARINYDTSVFALDTTNTTTMSPSTVVDKNSNGFVQWSAQDGIQSMAGGTLATIRFNVISGQEANVVGKQFYISRATVKDFDGAVTYTYSADAKVTITAAGGDEGDDDEPVVPTGTTAKEVKDAGNADKKIAAYDIANDENVKRVLIFTEEQTALTSESRFIVTGEGRTQKFGGDIWDRVGSVEGEGTMKVAKVIFGLIVDASATAADFTFSVGK